MNLAQIVANNTVRIFSWNNKNEYNKLTNKAHLLTTSDLNNIKWIWDDTISKLLDAWITSIDELNKTSEEKIKMIQINPISKSILVKYKKECEKSKSSSIDEKQ